jgi:hypothetical protein
MAKKHAIPRDAIEIRRLRRRISQAPRVAVGPVVADEEEDVRTRGRLRRSDKNKEREQCCEDEWSHARGNAPKPLKFQNPNSKPYSLWRRCHQMDAAAVSGNANNSVSICGMLVKLAKV